MMDMDVMQAKWMEHDRKLETSIRLNRRLLMATNMNRVRTPLRLFAFLAGLEATLGLLLPVILGQFIYAHWAEPRFMLPAVVLDAWAIATVAALFREMVMALQIDYDQPIAGIQTQVESLRVLRIRVTQWSVLTGQLVWWVPFTIVSLEGFWGVDAYQVFGGTVLAVNVLLGLALIPMAIWVSRKFGERMGRSPVIQRLMGELAGYNLNAATRFLATLSEFENETRDK